MIAAAIVQGNCVGGRIWGIWLYCLTGVQPDSQTISVAKYDLEQLSGRRVDLVESGSLRNPYVLANINRHREAVYAARRASSEVVQSFDLAI